MERHVDEPPQAEPVAPSSLTSPPPRRDRLVYAVLGVVALLLVGVIGLQLYTVSQAQRAADDVAAVSDAVRDLGTDLALVEGSVDEVSDRVAGIESATSDGGQSAAPALPAGYLPTFQSGQPDAALGRQFPSITGFEYYAQAERTVDPADGTNRLWMIWAHWCPYCQQELPALSEWYTTSAADYTSTELVTITTSIDDSRANPLVPYLDESSFPFPVLVDENLNLAARFGTSAFPFWVVTDGDGTVLFRVAGVLDVAQVESIFTQLEQA